VIRVRCDHPSTYQAYLHPVLTNASPILHRRTTTFPTETSYWWAGKAGDRVFCHWDIQNAKYWILLVEPNNHEYQNLVVSTPAGDKTIQLPPWTTIT